MPEQRAHGLSSMFNALNEYFNKQFSYKLQKSRKHVAPNAAEETPTAQQVFVSPESSNVEHFI